LPLSQCTGRRATPGSSKLRDTSVAASKPWSGINRDLDIIREVSLHEETDTPMNK
jgi:hypothetical protein